MMGAYADAGVDVAAADALVGRIAPAVTATWGEGVVGTFGGFAAGVRIPAGYQHPVLAMTTDGVGTKAEVARMAGRVEGLGHDLVAMCVDDLAAAGVRPLAMTDYLAVGSLDHVDVEGIVRSIARACGEAGVALIGGETAVHPDVMAENGFDLAGAAVGVVEDGQQVDGTRIVAGDAIVGVASPNLRSNGFSLLRSRVLPNVSMGGVVPGTDASWTDLVLAPSVIYSPAVAAVIEAVAVHGLAHITGGGLRGNVPRNPAGRDKGRHPPAHVAASRDLRRYHRRHRPRRGTALRGVQHGNRVRGRGCSAGGCGGHRHVCVARP